MTWPVELWKAIFDWGTVILVSLTVLTGAGALITGKIIGDRQDEKIAELNKRASEADKSAADFAHRTAGLEKDAATAKRDAEKFKSDIASANERASNADKAAAEAKLELEKLKTPRMLTAEQQHRIEDAIRQFPKIPFDISAGADPEAIDFATQIEAMLLNAGWEEIDIGGTINLSREGKKSFGIALSKGLSAEIQQARRFDLLSPLDILVGAIRKEGFEIDGRMTLTGNTPNAVHIRVGRK